MEKHTFFHGTSSLYVDEIKAEGLKPKAKPGNDAHWSKAAQWHTKERDGSVYITPDHEVASLFATRTAKIYGGKPAVVSVEIPRSDWKAHLHLDEAGGNDFDAIDYLRYQGSIPAKDILDVAEISPIPGVEFD